MIKLHGIFPPIATPFDHKGDLYPIKVRHNIEKWNRTPLAGYAVCGSTGESVYLTTEEKIKMWEWVAEYADASKILIAGTGVESVRETVALTNQTAEFGYKVAMVRTPHYYKNLLNRPDAQVLYFRAVADQAKIPVLIYNWPQATGIDIMPEAVAMLSEHPNIIAIKESSGNLEKVMQMIRETKAGFQVLTGSAPTLAPSFAVGCVGAGFGVRERRSVCNGQHLGSSPHARARSRDGLAEPYRARGAVGHHQIRHSRSQIRDGPERLLRRTAAPASHRAEARGAARDRASLRRD